MTRVDRERWLALGLLLGVLVLAYAVLVHPWWTVPMREEIRRVDALQQRELRQRMQLKQAPLVRERLGQLRQASINRPGFLPEASAELATVGLVQRLETAVAQASPGNRSCAITNRSPVTDSTADRYPRVVVQARLRCGTGELATVLYSLEAGSPRLFVDNLNILAMRNFMPTAGGGEGGDGGLDVSFDLYGYLRPAPGAAPAARIAQAANAGDDDAP